LNSRSISALSEVRWLSSLKSSLALTKLQTENKKNHPCTKIVRLSLEENFGQEDGKEKIKVSKLLQERSAPLSQAEEKTNALPMGANNGRYYE
jgi:hypothetical protein